MSEKAPSRVIYRYMHSLSIWYYGISGIALLIFSPYLAWRFNDWRFGIIPAIGALYFIIRLGLVPILILIAEPGQLTIIRRPFLHWFGSFEILAANEIRRIRYGHEIHERKDSDDRKYGEDHFRLDVIATDSRIIKVIDSTEQALHRKTLRMIAQTLRVEYEENLNPPPN